MSEFKTEIYAAGVVLTLAWHNEEEYRLGQAFLTKLAGPPAKGTPGESRDCYYLYSEDQFEELLDLRKELRRKRGLE